MNILPPLPPWEGLHPLVIHFPIALLLIAPLFLVLALLLRKHEQPLAWCALLLMALGTAGAALAVATGDAAEDNAEHIAAAAATLDRHEDLAESARNVFIGLTIVYAILLLVPRFFRKPPPRALHVAAHLLFVAVYLGGTTLLARAAHEGGRLVHEFGVRSVVAPAPGAADRPDAALADNNRAARTEPDDRGRNRGRGDDD